MIGAAGLYKLTIAGRDGHALDVSASPPLQSWHPVTRD